jgi:hypothetical protein
MAGDDMHQGIQRDGTRRAKPPKFFPGSGLRPTSLDCFVARASLLAITVNILNFRSL